ncbi:hypothetical protein [Mycobacterium intracellulare]|uniref:hypothetical protein n=1 Tax=Mycobacterium intracellulare TaxID=1767 RepID=UPI0034D65CCA
MGLTAASSGQLELAAEQTIAAAAAALLWAGPDSHGVLTHVASTSAAKMAESRRAYAFLAFAREFVEAEAQQDFDKELSSMIVAFEVAALPATAVSSWAAALSEALNEACQHMRADSYSDSSGIVMPHPDAAVQRRSNEEFVNYLALQACNLWGRDPLPINLIEFSARAVSISTATSPAARF